MEAKVTFKLYNQQLKIHCELHFLICFDFFWGGRRVKPRGKSPFCPVCIDGGSIPVDLLTFIFYHECLLMSNNFFSEGPVLWSAFLLPYWQDYICPLAVFLLKCKDFIKRAKLLWKQQLLSVVTFLHGWFLPNTKTGQRKEKDKRKKQQNEG